MVQSDQPSADATIGKAETPARQPLTFGQILVLPFVLAFFAARSALLFFVGLLLICLALYVLTYILDLSFVHHYLNNVKNSSYSIFHYWFPDERLHRMFPTPSK